MKYFTTTPPQHRSTKKGFASILTVLSIGSFLMIVLLSMYKTTVESQLTVKNNSLRGDYQHREEAFLRAMVANTPNTAMKCMLDDSFDVRNTLRWRDIINTSLTQSNSHTAASDTTLSGLGFSPTSMKNGNTGNASDTNLAWNTVVTRTTFDTAGAISPGVNSPNKNITASINYPAPLSTSRNLIRNRDRNYPIISHEKIYDAVASGWVGADVTQNPQHNIVASPSSYFSYNNSDTLIAKHNWWAFNLDFSAEDTAKTNLATSSKEYILSIYEIPSQLALSSNSIATFGGHNDGSDTAWGTNISIEGSVFAEDLTTMGSFSVDSVTSRKGVTLSSGTTFNDSTITGSSAGSNPMASNMREDMQMEQTAFPISASSDGGKVAFIPINRGISFYDRFAGLADITEADAVTEAGANTIGSSSWNYYSNGAHQCAMNLDIIGVNSGADQTVKAIQFRYLSGGVKNTMTFRTADNTWPNPTSANGLEFPFHTELTTSGSTRLVLYLNRLSTYLLSIGADSVSENNSLSINADYTDSINTFIQNPSDDYDAANSILLKNAQNLRDYDTGFSLVTNMRLIIEGAVNTTTKTDISIEYPAVSLFAPQKRFGDLATAVPIEINGQIGTIGEDSTSTTNPLDLLSGTAAILDIDNITANLTSITHPDDLPPINMMNWMVLIREKSPAN